MKWVFVTFQYVRSTCKVSLLPDYFCVKRKKCSEKEDVYFFSSLVSNCHAILIFVCYNETAGYSREFLSYRSHSLTLFFIHKAQRL